MLILSEMFTGEHSFCVRISTLALDANYLAARKHYHSEQPIKIMCCIKH